jgi:hypothetical protein
LAVCATQASAQEGYGQITLDNKTDSAADLYVDGAYGCHALSGLFCTTQVRVGTHDLEAKTADGLSTTVTGVAVAQGESRTWTIQNTYQ